MNEWAPIVENLANNDPENLVKAAAITQLSRIGDVKYKPLFEKSVKIPSRSIKVAAATALVILDPSLAGQYVDIIDLKKLNGEQFMFFLPYILKNKNFLPSDSFNLVAVFMLPPDIVRASRMELKFPVFVVTVWCCSIQCNPLSFSQENL